MSGDALREWHRRWVLERKGGLAGLALRAGLRAASLGFGVAVEVRRWAYDRGWLAARHPGVPVIAVGNIAAGGTGKTPLVDWIAGRLLARGLRVAVIARGYGAAAGELGDELVQLSRALPGLIAVRSADRLAGAAEAIARGAQVIVLDDAFQHRRIRRDLDIAVVSARDPWAGGALLPRGLLREPPAALRRAQLVVLSHADALDDGARDVLRARLGELAGGAPVLCARHRARGVRVNEALCEPAWLAGRRVFAASGIGDPAAFEGALVALGAELVGARRFPDHHRYTAAEREALAREAHAAGALWITTAKDAARLPATAAPAVFEIALALDEPERLESALDRALATASTGR